MIEISQHYNDKSINFLYEFNHNNLLYVDVKKMLKVFNKILFYLIDNSSNECCIWFHTKEILYKGKVYIKFMVGTNGFYVNKCNLNLLLIENKKENLIDFEKNIPNLSLVKKIIEAHGGKIDCKSISNIKYPDGMIEFYITLPSSHEYFKTELSLLPKDSDQAFKYSHFFFKYQNVILCSVSCEKKCKLFSFTGFILIYFSFFI
ncbi:hypothetical protein QEJ31_07045 [Pigmentibacter sp. JX0631]|uniref:hypothetical protein n=1 Tax=Pigmentibacter sp. JX0631 TaxID=2976982 RepID=UPI002468EF3F|nr:hypothetical protein [Pigmentibacter sp. JX0631]WGL61349.1 hypothetical protein QEJ31_07045 [Pigmentibacter sp. JX0631]